MEKLAPNLYIYIYISFGKPMYFKPKAGCKLLSYSSIPSEKKAQLGNFRELQWLNIFPEKTLNVELIYSQIQLSLTEMLQSSTVSCHFCNPH